MGSADIRSVTGRRSVSDEPANTTDGALPARLVRGVGAVLWRRTVRVMRACKGLHGRNCGQHGARMTGPLWAFLSLAMGASVTR